MCDFYYARLIKWADEAIMSRAQALLAITNWWFSMLDHTVVNSLVLYMSNSVAVYIELNSHLCFTLMMPSLWY